MSLPLPAEPTNDDRNPYEPPRAAFDLDPAEPVAEGPLAEAEAIRKAHIRHEASVKSIGTLHFLGAFFCFFGAAGMMLIGLVGAKSTPGPAVMFGIGVFYLAVGSLHLALGLGLVRLKPWARATDVVLITLMLLLSGGATILMAIETRSATQVFAYCLGALIPAYMLYLLVSPKATTVFSPEYKTIIAQTPHIKHRTSLVIKILAAILVVILALAVVGAFVIRRR